MRVWISGISRTGLSYAGLVALGLLLRSRLRFGPDFDLLACDFQTLRAHLQVDSRLINRCKGILEGKVAIFEELELLVQLLERLLVGQLLAHDSTSSTRAPRRPAPSLMRTRRSTAVSFDVRSTAPDSASCVML